GARVLHARGRLRPRAARRTRPHPRPGHRPPGARPRHRRGTRRRNSLREHPDRHAVRTQPHRRLALPGRVRRRGRLRGRGDRARRRTGGTGVQVTQDSSTGGSTPRTYWLEHAWLGDRVEPGVTAEVRDGVFTAVVPGVTAPPPGAEVLRGLTLPGLANAHSHAFHRALRGTVQVGSGTFWTWREVMYSVADRL